MKKHVASFNIIIILAAIVWLNSCKDSPEDIIPAASSRIADHTVVRELWEGRIPAAGIQQAKDRLAIAYGHTSHGSQITDGMSGLTDFADAGNLGRNYPEGMFEYNPTGADGALNLMHNTGGFLEGDVGGYPQWVYETNEFLADKASDDYNVIMWSWCGQVSTKTEHQMIDEYLKPMSDFETAHPEITFVYMTGHLDGSGAEGNLHHRNEQIRSYCRKYNKWLFDFADIESHDPEGNCYLEKNCNDACAYDGGNWATEWQNSHNQGTDWYNCNSAHSQPLNANMKAYAAWWLFTEIAE